MPWTLAVVPCIISFNNWKLKICGILSFLIWRRQSIKPLPAIRFNIQHPESSIQYPASSIQYPESSIQHPASSIQYPATLNVEWRLSNDEWRNSLRSIDFSLPASKHPGLQAFRHPVSSIEHPESSIQYPIQPNKLNKLNFRIPSAESPRWRVVVPWPYD